MIAPIPSWEKPLGFEVGRAGTAVYWSRVFRPDLQRVVVGTTKVSSSTCLTATMWGVSRRQPFLHDLLPTRWFKRPIYRTGYVVAARQRSETSLVEPIEMILTLAISAAASSRASKKCFAASLAKNNEADNYRKAKS